MSSDPAFSETPHVPRSAVAGNCWPAVPVGRAASVLAIQFQLAQSQWWSADTLRDWQLRQLDQLLRHACLTVPFYRERLGRLGLRLDSPITPEQWRRIPLLTRSVIQDRETDLHSTEVPADHGKISTVYTSGSTGQPIRAIRTDLAMLFWEAFTQRDHLWHDRDRHQKLAVIRHAEPGKDPYPQGTIARNWGSENRAAYATGPCVALNITCPLEQQAEWLQRHDPGYLLTFPSHALRLAEHFRANGLQLANLRQVQAIAEVVTRAVREACGEAWGVPVVDTYSTRETGYLALQCPEHEHLHVQSEGALLEVLGEQGRDCGPGQIGRVVVTPLHNFAMPLVRYDIGDYAEVGEACPCGRGLPVLRRILGRSQNTIVLPSGERCWTLLSSGDIGELYAVAPVRQYQFVQTDREHIEARLVVSRPLMAAEEDGVRQWLQRRLGYPFIVSLVYVEEIPRSPGGKFHDFISHAAA